MHTFRALWKPSFISKLAAEDLHDYSVKRMVSRLEGNMVFNAGEWQAKLSDGKQYHGYYSALLVREGDGVKIFGETTNVALPYALTPVRGKMK